MASASGAMRASIRAVRVGSRAIIDPLFNLLLYVILPNNATTDQEEAGERRADRGLTSDRSVMLPYDSDRSTIVHTAGGPTMSLRAILSVVLAVAALSALPAQAQNYPTRPVRVILPFAAGGIADISTRLISEKLGDRLGERIVVD